MKIGDRVRRTALNCYGRLPSGLLGEITIVREGLIDVFWDNGISMAYTRNSNLIELVESVGTPAVAEPALVMGDSTNQAMFERDGHPNHGLFAACAEFWHRQQERLMSPPRRTKIHANLPYKRGEKRLLEPNRTMAHWSEK